MPNVQRKGVRVQKRTKRRHKDGHLSNVRRSRHPNLKSGLENKIYYDAIKRGIKVEYEPETFEYERRVVGGKCRSCASRDVARRARYTPDFRLDDGSFIEAKGKFDAATRGKMEDFIRSRPDVPIRFIFGRDNWCTKKRVRRYSDWCNERGIKWHVGEEIPDEWVPKQ